MRFQIGIALAMAVTTSGAVLAQAPPAQPTKPAQKIHAPPKTVWDDPQIAGVYTNNDESLILFKRPGAVRRTSTRGHQ
jgi:hypothetical protein